MYSLNSSNLTGTTLFDHWPNTRYNIICPLGKYQIYTTLFAHWANTRLTLFAHWAITRYNIVCPDKYQIYTTLFAHWANTRYNNMLVLLSLPFSNTFRPGHGLLSRGEGLGTSAGGHKAVLSLPQHGEGGGGLFPHHSQVHLWTHFFI